MEHLNKQLLSTLSQDLKELKRISDEITQKTNAPNTNLWLFPTKTYEDLDKNKSENVYVVCLELIIDRLYVITNAIIINFENILASSSQQKQKNTGKPKNLTLATCVNLMWDQMMQIENMLIVRNFEKTRNKQETVVTQTDLNTLTVCDSCDVAKGCIKNLITEIEKVLHKSAVTEVKKKVHSNIFNMTQFGSMTLLTTALIRDIKNLVTENENLEYTQTKTEHELVSMESTVKELKSLYENKEKNYEDLELELHRVQKENESFIERIKTLSLTKEQLETKTKEHEKDMTNLKKILANVQNKLRIVTDEKAVLETNIKNLSKDISIHSSEREMWHQKYNESTSEKLELASKYKEMQQDIITVQENLAKEIQTMARCHKYYTGIIDKQNECKDLLMDIKGIIKDLLVSEREYVDAVKNNVTVPLLIKDMKVKGDPFADMSNQVEVNNKNIEILQKQNEKLMKTLSRFQKTFHNKC